MNRKHVCVCQRSLKLLDGQAQELGPEQDLVWMQQLCIQVYRAPAAMRR